MDWVKEKKKHDFLDEFEKWINLDEVVTPKRQSSGSSKDNINLRVARNFTLVTDLDMKINGGTIYIPTELEGGNRRGIPRYGRAWEVFMRYENRISRYSIELAMELAPHTLALFLNVAGFTRIYPEFAWAATPGMCPMGIAWRAPRPIAYIQKKWDEENNREMGEPMFFDSEDEERMEEFQKRKKRKIEEHGENVED